MSASPQQHRALKQPPFVQYFPSLVPFTGSIMSAILMQALEGLFSYEPEGGQAWLHGFYFYAEPPKKIIGDNGKEKPHPHYRPGMSFQEKIGFSNENLKTAFSEIGTIYATKKAYLQAKESGDPFCGKLYLLYIDKLTNQTFYLRNHKAANDLIELWQSSTVDQTSSPKMKLKKLVLETDWPSFIQEETKYQIASEFLKLKTPFSLQQILDEMRIANSKEKIKTPLVWFTKIAPRIEVSLESRKYQKARDDEAKTKMKAPSQIERRQQEEIDEEMEDAFKQHLKANPTSITKILINSSRHSPLFKAEFKKWSQGKSACTG